VTQFFLLSWVERETVDGDWLPGHLKFVREEP
jgi:hypothetical protein